MAPVTASPLLLEEPIRLASILEHSTHARTVPSLTKIVGTVGGNSRTAEQLQELIEAGMSTARFDLSYHDVAYHLESLENLKAAMAKTKKLCAVMVDTRGPEVTIANPSKEPVLLEAGSKVVVGERGEGERSVPSSTFLPVSVPGLAKAVQVGKEIFVGQYLFTGSETTSVWLHVTEVRGDDIVCEVMNTASIKGSFFTVHAADVTIPVPTVSEGDKARIVEWVSSGNRIDILSLSFTRFGKDVKEMRAFLDSLKLPWKCHIYAKIGNIEGLKNFDSIVEEADGIILARGNLGIDVPAEKVFLFQKAAINRCNMAGKPAIISRVVDTMCDTPRPTRAEATDVANAVLDGVDGIMLGAETLRGLYPTEAVKTVELICAEAEKVFNQPYYFKQVLKAAQDPMTELESICSSAVDSAENVHASCILVFTSSGRMARMVAKYRPTMPTLVVVVPRLSTNQLTWSFSGETQARQALTMRGLFPILAEPKTLEDGDGVSNETLFRLSMERAKVLGFIRRHDRVVVVQKLKNSAIVRIVEA